jgi:hypothetical protein
LQLLILAASAHLCFAQFLGYVGLQTTYNRVLNNSTAQGRTLVNVNIGASFHTFTYCLGGGAATNVQVFVEESPDGQTDHFTQISPTVGFPKQQSNGNNCGIIRVGGYYSVLAFNVQTLVGGTPSPNISVWYTATAGPTDVYPPAVGSNGGASLVQCDETVTSSAIPPGTILQLIPQSPAGSVFVCGGTISFSGATTAGEIDLLLGGGVNCGGVPSVDTIYAVAITASSPQLFQINSAPNSFLQPAPHPALPAAGTVEHRRAVIARAGLPAPRALGFGLCISTGSIGANTTVTLSYAQF